MFKRYSSTIAPGLLKEMSTDTRQADLRGFLLAALQLPVDLQRFLAGDFASMDKYHGTPLAAYMLEGRDTQEDFLAVLQSGSRMTSFLYHDHVECILGLEVKVFDEDNSLASVFVAEFALDGTIYAVCKPWDYMSDEDARKAILKICYECFSEPQIRTRLRKEIGCPNEPVVMQYEKRGLRYSLEVEGPRGSLIQFAELSFAS